MISLTALAYGVLWFIVGAAIVGLLLYAIDRAPFVPGEWKGPAKGVVIVFVIFVVIFALLGMMTGRQLFAP